MAPSTPMLSAQACPTYLPVDGNTTTIDGFIQTSGTCTEPGNPPVQSEDNWLSADGGYVKIGTLLKLHTAATTSGECLWRDTDRWIQTGACNHNPATPQPDLRTINHVKIYEMPPTWLQTTLSTWRINEQGYTIFRQELDTRNVGTTAPNPHTSTPLGDIGTWNYKFKSIVNQTNCSVGPAESELITRPVNVVACLPRFQPPGDSGRLPNDGQPIKVMVPVDEDDPLAIAINRAINRWKDILSPLGVNFTFNEIGVTCLVSDNHCIEIWDLPPPADPSACAQAGAPPDSNGVMKERARIYVNPTYRNFDNQQRVDNIMAHELGHLLGLEHSQPECIVNNEAASIMNVAQGCSSSMAGLVDRPQPSDALPVAKSMYGSTPKKTCG